MLQAIFAHACAAGRIDELGNGRFARSLYERACACRDLRVENLADPSREDLVTLTAADVQAAYRELDHGVSSGGLGPAATGGQGGSVVPPGTSGTHDTPIAVPEQN